MLVPLSWLKDYVDINVTLDDLAYRLTMSGLAVEKIERLGADWERDKIFGERRSRGPALLAGQNLGCDNNIAGPQNRVEAARNAKAHDAANARRIERRHHLA